MSYDRQDATEQPTTIRLRRAREEGQVARSSDLSSSLVSLIAVGFALYWMPKMIVSLEALLSQGLSFSSDSPNALLTQASISFLDLLWLPCLVLFIGAIFFGIIQVGGIFAPVAAKFDLHRVDPIAGSARLFGSHGWMHLVFCCSKIAAVVLGAGAIGMSYKHELLSLSNESLVAGVAIAGEIAGKMALAAAGSLLALGLFDMAWQRHQWKAGLKMTRQEVIAERREQEGNSKLRSHRRIVPFSQHAKERIAPSLVIVGKTLAISIRWNPTAMSSPVVLAFIRNEEIAQLVEKATSLHIPVQVHHRLCTRIEQLCDVGSAIPPMLHSEIASILTIGRRKIA
tara:strand:+ start:1540 stop:2562 length:1023 start_codon:yes stop_codon:yes gene_type:complete